RALPTRARRGSVRWLSAAVRERTWVARRVGALLGDALLAPPRLTDDRRLLAMPGSCELLGAAELFQLGIAAHESRQPAPGGRLQAGPRRARPGHLVNLDWRAQPLDVDRAEGLDLDKAFGESECVGRHEDRARHRHLLHARREVRRLANGGVIHVQVTADRADHDLARVQADPDLDGDSRRALDYFRIALARVLHPPRRLAGAHGGVLTSDRRAEQRHDPVTHHLSVVSLVTGCRS